MNTSALLIIVSILLFSSTCFGQITASTDPILSLAVSIPPVEIHAEPVDDSPSGDRPIATTADEAFSFHNFFSKNVEYPEIATDNAMEGVVVLRLWVASTGTVEVLGVDRSDYALLDTAVLAAAKELPELRPALVDGQAIGQSVLVPVHFSLK